jgi:hypothetical protein
MKMSTVLLAFCFLASLLAAQEKSQSAASEKSAGPSTGSNDIVWKARPKPADSTATLTAAGASEVYQDVVIPPGKNVIIQSTQNYASSSTVAVAVLCTACTTATTAMAALGLVLEARWQPLNGTTDIATANAGTFAYLDAGGAVFSVYAELFNLELQNKGTSTITLDQVTIFSPAQ